MEKKYTVTTRMTEGTRVWLEEQGMKPSKLMELAPKWYEELLESQETVRSFREGMEKRDRLIGSLTDELSGARRMVERLNKQAYTGVQDGKR